MGIFGTKQGKQNPLMLLMALGFLAVSGVIVWQALAGAPTTQTISVGGGSDGLTAADLNAGTSSTLKLTSYDREADALTQVAATATVRDKSTGALLLDAGSLSASATTSVSSSVGSVVQVALTGTSYYGDFKDDVQVPSALVPVTINAHAISTSTTVTPFDNNDAAIANNDANVTLAASETQYWSRLRFKQSTANKAFNLAGIAVNLSQSTNVQSVAINGLAQKPCPTSLSSSCFAYFELPQPVMLHQYEYFDTGSVIFKAKGTNPSETGSLIFVDATWYKSVKPETMNQLLFGIQDDQPTPVDIGATNKNVALNVN